MREIKFREYNSHWKKMYTPFTLVQAITAGGISDRYNQHSIFMQYTGLKDKNNVQDIYEGDIGKNYSNELYVVRYDEELASFIAIYDGNIIYDLHEVNDEIEIIGNIYENPELLSNPSEEK